MLKWSESGSVIAPLTFIEVTEGTRRGPRTSALRRPSRHCYRRLLQVPQPKRVGLCKAQLLKIRRIAAKELFNRTKQHSMSFERRILQILGLGHEVVRNLLEAVHRRQMWTDPRQAGACLRRLAQISYEFFDHDCSFRHGEKDAHKRTGVVAAIASGAKASVDKRLATARLALYGQRFGPVCHPRGAGSPLRTMGPAFAPSTAWVALPSQSGFTLILGHKVAICVLSK